MQFFVKPLTVILGLSSLLTLSCNQETTKETASVANETPVQRGEYLVNAMGCDDCHSPKTMGPKGPQVIAELRFSGYPHDRPIVKPDGNQVKQGWTLFSADLCQAAGPWGISFAANITSDSTGIGTWTEEQFLKAIKEGKSKGLDNSRPLLPPMPWPNYARLKDDDIKAIFAYLKSTKAVHNNVPAPMPL